VAVLLVLLIGCTPRARPQDRKGRAVDVDVHGSSMTLVHFWASWCGPCRDELPQFVAFAAEHRLRVVAISQDRDYESADRFLRANGVVMETLLDADGRYGASLHLRVIPTTIAYGPNGAMIDRFDQSVDWRDPAIARRLLR